MRSPARTTFALFGLLLGVGSQAACRESGAGKVPPEYSAFIGRDHLAAIMRTDALVAQLEAEVRSVRTDIAVANTVRERPDRVAADAELVATFTATRLRAERLKVANQDTWQRSLIAFEHAHGELTAALSVARATLTRPGPRAAAPPATANEASAP